MRLRPSTAEMEVDLAIDLDSKNFDRDSGHAATMKKQVHVIYPLNVKRIFEIYGSMTC